MTLHDLIQIIDFARARTKCESIPEIFLYKSQLDELLATETNGAFQVHSGQDDPKWMGGVIYFGRLSCIVILIDFLGLRETPPEKYDFSLLDKLQEK